MKISGMSLSVGSNLTSERPVIDKQIPKKSQNQAQSAEPLPNAPVNSDHLPGVIRLLQEGHFKGVADVRLRINFFEELQTLQETELRSAVGEAIPDFLEDMGKSLDTLLSSESLSDDQVSAIMAQGDKFTQAVEQLLENSQATPDLSKDSLISTIDASFQELTASIQSVLASTEASGEVPGSADGDPGETVPLDSITGTGSGATETAATDMENLLEALKSSYYSALDVLQNTLDEAGALPPLSEPEGNGTAYAKFLSIYQDMLDGLPQSGTGSSVAVDSVV